MFLVQISKKTFVNAEKISAIVIHETGNVSLYINGDVDCEYKVQEEYVSSALNHIQALQNNTNNIESYYRKIIGENTNEK